MLHPQTLEAHLQFTHILSTVPSPLSLAPLTLLPSLLHLNECQTDGIIEYPSNPLNRCGMDTVMVSTLPITTIPIVGNSTIPTLSFIGGLPIDPLFGAHDITSVDDSIDLFVGNQEESMIHNVGYLEVPSIFSEFEVVV